VKSEPSTSPVALIGTVLACAILGGGAVATGAWCSELTLNCVAYFPLGVVGGSLFFGLPLLVVDTILISLLALVLRVRITVAVFAVLVLLHIAIGAAIGSTLLRGQGP
jgi:hypothetical protein